MSKKSKMFEVLELLSEKRIDEATKVFHEHIVETSKKIYENYDFHESDDDEEDFGGFGDDNMSDDLNSDMSDIDSEEMANLDQSETDIDSNGELTGEDDLEGDFGDDVSDPDMDADLGMDADVDGDEGRIDDLESALAELKAEFEKLEQELTAGDSDDLEGDMDGDDLDLDMDTDGDDVDVDVEDVDGDDLDGGDDTGGEYDFTSDDEEEEEKPVVESAKLKPQSVKKVSPTHSKPTILDKPASPSVKSEASPMSSKASGKTATKPSVKNFTGTTQDAKLQAAKKGK